VAIFSRVALTPARAETERYLLRARYVGDHPSPDTPGSLRFIPAEPTTPVLGWMSAFV